MSEESTPPQVSVQDFLWYMICPCCCSNPMDSFAPDAVKLTPEEAKTYVDQMQGLWEVIVTEIPQNISLRPYIFQRVYVSGNVMTYSGGPEGRTQRQEICLHKTPDGTLYLDKYGTKCTEFSPQNGIIQYTTITQFKGMFKREPVHTNPVVTQELPPPYSAFEFKSNAK